MSKLKYLITCISLLITVLIAILITNNSSKNRNEKFAYEFLEKTLTLGENSNLTLEQYHDRENFYKSLYIDKCNKYKHMLENQFECKLKFPQSVLYDTMLIISKPNIKNFKIVEFQDKYKVTFDVSFDIKTAISGSLFNQEDKLLFGDYVSNFYNLHFFVKDSKVLSEGNLYLLHQLYLFWNTGELFQFQIK